MNLYTLLRPQSLRVSAASFEPDGLLREVSGSATSRAGFRVVRDAHYPYGAPLWTYAFPACAPIGNMHFPHARALGESVLLCPRPF